MRAPVTVPIQTGLKVIDALIPIGRGQRELILGDRQTGKTAVAIDTILNQRKAWETGDPKQQVRCVYVAVGQKGTTIASVRRALEEGVWPDGDPPTRALTRDGGIPLWYGVKPTPRQLRTSNWAPLTLAAPLSKVHSGCSPAMGLYTQCTGAPSPPGGRAGSRQGSGMTPSAAQTTACPASRRRHHGGPSRWGRPGGASVRRTLFWSTP